VEKDYPYAIQVVDGNEAPLAVDAATTPTLQIFDQEKPAILKTLELISRDGAVGAYVVLIKDISPLVVGRLYWFRTTAVVAAATIVAAETIRFEDNSRREYIYQQSIGEQEFGANPDQSPSF